MSYESIDKLQNDLADDVFKYANDKKKAAGRALGTILEIISYYLIKTWKFDVNAAIERPLPEYANSEIKHNVEFTLHGSEKIAEDKYCQGSIISSSDILKKINCQKKTNKKGTYLVDRYNAVRNACNVCSDDSYLINAYLDSQNQAYSVYKLQIKPFAMVECKRVGVEEGSKKGPQTIEKAKQGSYVARTVSSLQKIRKKDGTLAGVLQKRDGDFIIEDYYFLLDKALQSDDSDYLKDLILTIGIVSNHGNWFTSSNQNKELKVLAQSYDWLLFLSDRGISQFITDLLIDPNNEYLPVKEAFKKSYPKSKAGNLFTKTRMDLESDKALSSYFEKNISQIEGWFNVITPADKKIGSLKEILKILSDKNWKEIYSK